MKPLKTILTIDDDDDIRLISTMILKKKGDFDVVAKPSGEAGIAYLQSLEGDENKPDLILLDVMMPQMDGTQTLKKIKEMDVQSIAEIPIIFMTAKCQPDEVKRLIELGAVDVIPKPFDSKKLVDQLHDIWASL